MFTINFYDNIIFNFYAQSGVLFQTHKDTYSKYVVVTGNNKKGFPYVKHFFVLFFAIMKMWLNLVFLFVISSMFEASQARSCNDKNLKSCPKWASNGYCIRSSRFMKRNCKKSCNKCPGKICLNNCDGSIQYASDRPTWAYILITYRG